MSRSDPTAANHAATSVAHRHPLRLQWVAVLAVIGVLLVGVLSLLVGPSGWWADPVIRELRLVRTLCAAGAGAALAVAGVLTQALFRNPLASPDVIGTTAGAMLGGKLVLLSYSFLAGALPLWLTQHLWLAPELLLPAGCVVGAGLALMALLRLARGATDNGVVVILLTGFVLTTVIGALSSLLNSLVASDWELLRAMQAFGLGGVDGKGWPHVALIVPVVVIGTGAAWAWARTCDLLLSGEEEAAAMGVDVAQARRWLLVWIAVLSAAAVAVGGMVVFVGLVVPHVVRSLVGPGHRRLVPLCAVGGALLVVGCDITARAIPWVAISFGLRSAGDLPLGVITGLIGGPLFLILVLRARRQGWLT